MKLSNLMYALAALLLFLLTGIPGAMELGSVTITQGIAYAVLCVMAMRWLIIFGALAERSERSFGFLWFAKRPRLSVAARIVCGRCRASGGAASKGDRSPFEEPPCPPVEICGIAAGIPLTRGGKERGK